MPWGNCTIDRIDVSEALTYLVQVEGKNYTVGEARQNKSDEEPGNKESDPKLKSVKVT